MLPASNCMAWHGTARHQGTTLRWPSGEAAAIDQCDGWYVSFDQAWPGIMVVSISASSTAKRTVSVAIKLGIFVVYFSPRL